MKQKYVFRLMLAEQDGLRSCPVEKADEDEVRKIFSENDHYYFTENNGELWLNWE